MCTHQTDSCSRYPEIVVDNYEHKQGREIVAAAFRDSVIWSAAVGDTVVVHLFSLPTATKWAVDHEIRLMIISYSGDESSERPETFQNPAILRNIRVHIRFKISRHCCSEPLPRIPASILRAAVFAYGKKPTHIWSSGIALDWLCQAYWASRPI